MEREGEGGGLNREGWLINFPPLKRGGGVIREGGLNRGFTLSTFLDFVSGLHNCLEFSQTLLCLYQAMQTQKTFSIA